MAALNLVLRFVADGLRTRASSVLFSWAQSGVFLPGRIRTALLRRGGVAVEDAHLGRHLRFENRNVVIGSGAFVGDGVEFIGLSCISVRPDSIIRPYTRIQPSASDDGLVQSYTEVP